MHFFLKLVKIHGKRQAEYEREHKLEILKAAATYYIKNPLDYEFVTYERI